MIHSGFCQQRVGFHNDLAIIIYDDLASHGSFYRSNGVDGDGLVALPRCGYLVIANGLSLQLRAVKIINGHIVDNIDGLLSP